MKTTLDLRLELEQVEAQRRRLRKQLRKSKGLPAKKKGRGCGLDRDEAEKVARGYVEAGSFVRRDGSEKLVGADWHNRKYHLGQRSGGYCERFVVLGKPHEDGCPGRGGEAHHIVKRSVRRDDRLSNLADLSHVCHKAEDARRPRWGNT